MTGVMVETVVMIETVVTVETVVSGVTVKTVVMLASYNSRISHYNCYLLFSKSCRHIRLKPRPII